MKNESKSGFSFILSVLFCFFYFCFLVKIPTFQVNMMYKSYRFSRLVAITCFTLQARRHVCILLCSGVCILLCLYYIISVDPTKFKEYNFFRYTLRNSNCPADYKLTRKYYPMQWRMAYVFLFIGLKWKCKNTNQYSTDNNFYKLEIIIENLWRKNLSLGINAGSDVGTVQKKHARNWRNCAVDENILR